MADLDELPEVTVSATPLNNPSAAPRSRAPRGIVKINGNSVAGWIDFSVTNNTYFEADTFNVTFAAQALIGTYDAEFFSSITGDTFIEILAGLPADPENPKPSELTSLIYGRIDDIDFDAKNQTLTITGRDLAGALIDGKQPREFVNKTASQIATTLAGIYGLTAQVAATTGYVGSPAQSGDYQLNHTEGSDWELLVGLARSAGYVLYVTQQTLFFQQDAAPNSTPYLIQWTPATDSKPAASNAAELSFTRTLTVVKGVTVVAQAAGWPGNKASLTRSYPTGARAITPGKASPFGATTVYTFRRPAGTTAAALEQFALDQYKRITSHAMKLAASLPADGVLTTRGIIKVKGTQTEFDQTYFPRSVTRTLNKDGYRMTVAAQNFTPSLASST